MPTGLIENDDRVGTGGYCCSDLIEVKLHGFGVAERQKNQGSAGSMFGTDRTEQIGRLGSLIMLGSVTRALPDAVDGCAGRPAKGRRWKSVTVKE